MSSTLRLGFSPCPNDTFMFHGLVHDMVPAAGLRFAPTLLDIEALNRAALEQPRHFDITKLSVPALAASLDTYAVLNAGAALGRNCGPLVVSRPDRGIGTLGDLAGRRIAIPGLHTTAYLLLRIFGAPAIEPVAVRFDEVMPLVARGEVDGGLIIHESRFTFSQHGLVQVADLGELWEADTGLPLPLGIIAGRRSLSEADWRAVESGLAASVTQARTNPDASRDYVRQHAQEMDDAVCAAHIALYVNEFSQDLGDEGRRALEEILARGRAVGHLPAGPNPWR